MVPVTAVIILISAIIILILSILSTFCYLYHHLNPKNIYYVNEQGEIWRDLR